MIPWNTLKITALILWGFGAGALYATDSFMSEKCGTDRVGADTVFLWPLFAVGIGVVWVLDPDAIEPSDGECPGGGS